MLFLCKKDRKNRAWWGGTACHPMGNAYFLGLGKEDSPNSLVWCSGKGREKQRMMRGTSHPTAHTGRPHFLCNLGGGTHAVWQLVALQEEPIRNAWWEGSNYHPMADPMGSPQICLVWEERLTQLFIPYDCKGKAETVHDERKSSSHISQKNSPAFIISEGRLTFHCNIFRWKRKGKATHSERRILSHSEPRQTPFFI